MDLTSAICTLGCAMALALAGCSMPGGAGSTNLAETEPSPSGSPSPTTGPVGSGGPDATAPTAAGASTLPCDVDTVLVGHCQQCHSNPPQYGAPMPLVTYADLQAPSHSNPSFPVYQAVETRIHDDAAPMPQPPNPRLDATDTATIDSWVAASAPPGAACDGGPASDAGAGADANPAPGLSCTPDTVLAPGSAWSMPQTTEDVYVCYGVELGLTSERQVIGMVPNVVNHKIVHHMLLFQADEAVSATPAPCSAGGSLDWRIVYGWAPGGQAFNMPANVGFAEDGSTHWVVQVHYNNIDGLSGETDTSGFSLCTTDQLRPNEADVAAFGSMNFTIEPHDTLDITCSVTWDSTAVTAFAAFPHMHELGTTIGTNDLGSSGSGTPAPMGSVPAWNFQSQLWFPINVTLNQGDTIATRCAWNNTTDAPVSFGEYTEDEMCYSFTMYYPKITSSLWSWALPAATSSCAPTQ
jgi:hypothetical protein